MTEDYGYEYFHGTGSNYSKSGYEAGRATLVWLFHQRVEFVLSLGRYSHGRWLDVGCAYGLSVAEAFKMGFDAYGVDVSDYAISQAKQLFPNLSDRFFVSSCDKLSTIFSNESFDVISMFELVEHLEKPWNALAEARKLLKTKGLLLITTPDPNLATKDVDVTHINVNNVDYWKRTLTESGFKVKYPCLMYDTRLHGARIVRLLTRSSILREGYSQIKSRLNKEPSYNILAIKDPKARNGKG